MSTTLHLPPPPAAAPPRIAALEELAPAVRRAVLRTCDEVAQATGARPLVFETLRTPERQAYLFGFGRTWDDGRGLVTYSRDADESWHFYGLAADLIHPTLHWRAPESWWVALGHAARHHGLRWGADWDHDWQTADERFVDRPHVQWLRCKRAPSPRAARLFAEGGRTAVWREVGAHV